MQTNQPDLIAEGEHRRDAGMALAASPPHRLTRIMRAELAILDAILERGQATADDAAADPGLPYADGGRWLGSIFLRLCRDRLIHEVGVVRSNRPSRHRGKTGLYRPLDLDGCQRRAAEIVSWLDQYGAAEPASLFPE